MARGVYFWSEDTIDINRSNPPHYKRLHWKFCLNLTMIRTQLRLNRHIERNPSLLSDFNERMARAIFVICGVWTCYLVFQIWKLLKKLFRFAFLRDSGVQAKWLNSWITCRSHHSLWPWVKSGPTRLVSIHTTVSHGLDYSTALQVPLLDSVIRLRYQIHEIQISCTNIHELWLSKIDMNYQYRISPTQDSKFFYILPRNLWGNQISMETIECIVNYFSG